MAHKPTYEDLAQRVRELERTNFELNQAKPVSKEGDELLQKLIEISPLPFLLTRDEKIIFANPAATRLLGAEHQNEVIGRSPNEWVHQDFADKAFHRRSQAFEKGQSLNPFEMRLSTKDNRDVFVVANLAPVGYQGSKTLLSIFKDITKDKSTEKEMSRLNERFSVAVDSAGIGIWELDLEKKTLEWDEWMYRIYGIRPEAFGGVYEAWKNSFHPDDLAGAVREVQMAIRDEKPFDTSFRIVRPDGQIRHVRAFARVVKNDDNIPYKMVGVNYDISEQKQAEKSLQKAKERLSSLWDITKIADKDMKTIYDHVLAEVQKITESQYAFYGLLTDNEEEVTLYAWSEKVMPNCRVENKSLHFPIREAGIWGDAIREKRIITLNLKAAIVNTI